MRNIIKNRIIELIILLGLFSSVVVGCGEKTNNNKLDNWEKEVILASDETSDELYEKALEEGKLTIYTVSSRVFDAKKTFEKKYPGIAVEVKDVRGNELVGMLKDNYKDENFDCDVVICSDCDGTLFKELIEPGIVYTWIPDDIASVMKDGSDNRELEFMGEAMMLCYNTNVYDTQPIENLWELTEDRFKGKIMMANPLKSFSTYAFMAMLLQKNDELEQAYKDLYGTLPSPDEGETVAQMFERMLINNVEIAHASDEVVEAVGNSNGEILIGIMLSSKMRLMNLGYHFAPMYKMSPVSAVYTPNCISIAGGSKNINSAKLFIRYVTGDADGKSIGHEPFNTEGTWSVRDDIPDGNDVGLDDIDYIRIDKDYLYDTREATKEYLNRLIQDK